MRAVRVIRGDSLGVLPRLPAASFDLVATSPPYGAGKAYKGKGSLAAYEEFAAGWVAEVPRLLTPRGSLWINVGYMKLGANETLPLAYLYHRLALGHGLRLVQKVVWHFEGGLPYKRRFAHRTERLLWFALDPKVVHFDLDAVRDLSSTAPVTGATTRWARTRPTAGTSTG